MGEYADAFYRQEIEKECGFDPGSMYGEKPKKRKGCPKCGKYIKTDQGVKDHLRDYHGIAAKYREGV